MSDKAYDKRIKEVCELAIVYLDIKKNHEELGFILSDMVQHIHNVWMGYYE
jgi:hypothetical protein